MSNKSIEAQARLIAALGETMTDRMWADEILIRCGQIEEAVREIRRVADTRRGGER